MIKCNYAYRDRCREIPFADFNHNYKAWVCPLCRMSIDYIKENFKGEVYFKTPLWKLEGGSPEEENIQYFNIPEKVPELKLKPFDYQEEGIRFMIDRLNALGFVMNGDGVGLGKTLQSLGALKWFVENRGVSKILLVAKKSIKYQWESEIRRITGWTDVPIFVTGSTKKRREKAYDGFRSSDDGGILITNYHNFLGDYELIKALDFDFCILDEAHCVRAGKMNKRIGSVFKGKPSILLSGTPIMSKPEDIRGIVSIANPNYYGTAKNFEDNFLVKEFTIYGWQTIGAKNLDVLRSTVKNFYISRKAEIVFANNQDAKKPPKILPPIIRTVEMDPTQQKMHDYVSGEKTKLDEAKEKILNSSSKAALSLSNEAMQKIEELNERGKMFIASLQLISDDPSCFKFLSPEKGINKRLEGMIPEGYTQSPKTEATLDLLEEIISSENKALVFCHYSSVANLLAKRIETQLKTKPVLYTGQQNEEQREVNKKLFCEDEDTQIMVATEAAAEGLNLQVARYVIHFDQAETAAQKEQRIGRIARIGSKYSSVLSYDMVTENSFDQVRLNKIQKDAELAVAILD